MLAARTSKAAVGVLLPLARGTGGLCCGWLCFAFSAESTARNEQEMKLPLLNTDTKSSSAAQGEQPAEERVSVCTEHV